MPPRAVAAILRRIADACDAEDRDLAASRLSWLSADVLASIGTRLDFTTLSSLRGWGLIPARIAHDQG